MLEAGLVKLVMSDVHVTAICAEGGFYVSLPNDQPLPSWSYRDISDIIPVTLGGAPEGFAMRRLQIDVYAFTGGDVQRLARAIDRVLHCFKGTLQDEDSTLVFGCFRSDVIDAPLNPATRSFCRSLEYEIDFYST
jgi:hypothetical protein